MLSAGFDRDALPWKPFVEEGSLGWAMLWAVDPQAGSLPATGIDAFADDDDSQDLRKSKFLVAGLAGLGRLSSGDRSAFASRLSLDFNRTTRWSQMIERAADVGNPALVAMLAGFGMQCSDWSQMTPLHLYHITSALSAVGLKAEARMIAAEAVARG